MKCIVLAAGYGTRMRAVIGDLPKALIEIGELTILDRLLNDVMAIQGIDPVPLVVTNDRDHQHFRRWQASATVNVQLLNDGSTSNDNRLGAIGDLAFAMDAMAGDDDLLVLAADNLLTFSLAPLVQTFRAGGDLTLAVRHNPDREDQQRRGVVSLDGDRVTQFSEKPADPASDYAAAPMYGIPGRQCADIRQYLEDGRNPDAPGHLMEYLVGRYGAIAWEIPGDIIDVGHPGSYERALREFG